jgi:hypothetical protein
MKKLIFSFADRPKNSFNTRRCALPPLLQECCVNPVVVKKSFGDNTVFQDGIEKESGLTRQNQRRTCWLAPSFGNIVAQIANDAVIVHYGHQRIVRFKRVKLTRYSGYGVMKEPFASDIFLRIGHCRNYAIRDAGIIVRDHYIGLSINCGQLRFRVLRNGGTTGKYHRGIQKRGFNSLIHRGFSLLRHHATKAMRKTQYRNVFYET